MRAVLLRLLLLLSGEFLGEAQSTRPRVGLVLEGGAALGLAHIGILEWLEENRIPVDAIAGTSMGGLIGGLYAAGYTPAEIRAITREADWDRLLGGETRFRDLAFRRKEDRIQYPSRLELGVTKEGFQLPAGLNEGHAINMLLSRKLAAYGDLKSFDDLPTPFRCVAADLISGKAKVFGEGSLELALRSTMSIPVFFAPVRTKTEVFVDGGLLDNLPVDVARKMNVDVVIAVHLSKGPTKPGDIGSALSVMGRSVSVVIGAAELRTLELADVVLVADMSKFGVNDYTKGEELIAIGRAAAESKSRLLRALARPPEEYQALADSRVAKQRSLAKRLEFVRVTGTGVDKALEERIAQRLQGEYDPAGLEDELDKVVGLGRISSFRYQQVEREGKRGLEVEGAPRSTGGVFLNPAIEVNGVDTSNSRFSLASRLTWLDPWGLRSEWRNDLSFGARMAAVSELYKPFRDGGRSFWAPRAYIDSGILDLYSDGRNLAEYRVREQGFGLDVGTTFNRFSELRLGYQWNWIRARQEVGLPVAESLRAQRESVSLRFRLEAQDDNVVARKGLRLNTRLEHFPRGTEAIRGYSLGEVRGLYAQPVNRGTSLLAGFSGGSTVGPVQTTLFNFTLGGPQRLGSYGPNELQVRQYALLTLGSVYEFANEGAILGSKFYFVGLAQGARLQGLNPGTFNAASVSGAMVAKTFVGPIFLGGSFGDRGTRRWYFGIGRLF